MMSIIWFPFMLSCVLNTCYGSEGMDEDAWSVPYHVPDVSAPDMDLYDENDNHEPELQFLPRPRAKGRSRTSSYAEESNIHDTVGALARQLMLQQLFVEERIRSEGSSGLKQLRVTRDGTRPYHIPHHSGSATASIHEHSNTPRVVGMGEVIAVLNGVEFRTRHNDYQLKKPHSTSQDYQEEEDIEFPEVPPSVIEKSDVTEQTKEMREYFKAFKQQNVTHRDYRKYFRPVLCYLEGAWTKSGKNIDEPFDSPRHAIDAKTWAELLDKVRFTSYTGRKDNNENFAYLPMSIVNMINNTPEYAQWNYRIACHPLRGDLPVSKLRLVDDFVPRFSRRYTIDQYEKSRAARFRLDDGQRAGSRKYTLLDLLMSEIPGKDNYPGKIIDDAFGSVAYNATGGEGKVPLNAAYYHRFFEVGKKGAMGLTNRKRGYSDSGLFVALNTRPEVAAMTVRWCGKGWKRRICPSVSQRVSYAIPLEIIYMTPLNRWNPYNLKYYGKNRDPKYRTPLLGGRNGKKEQDKAYNGTNARLFYWTPEEFFHSGSNSRDPADTVRNSVGVLDADGVMRNVRSSGTRIVMPYIDDVGFVRQRYPIFPVHGEGSATWKELEALKDAVMEMQDFLDLYRKPPVSSGPDTPNRHGSGKGAVYETSYSRGLNRHKHEVSLTPAEVEKLDARGTVSVDTTFNMGHIHRLTIKKRNGRVIMLSCDGQRACQDGHTRLLKEAPSS